MTDTIRTEVYEGYTKAELRLAFDAVKDPQDWKAPITVVMPGEVVMPVVAAIKFYTATVPTVSLDVTTMRYLVESEGYHAGPAGDH